MKEIALDVDGSSTLTEAEFKKNNITRITVKITENDSISVNDEPEEINYEKMNGNHESGNFLKASCTALGRLMNVVDELLLKNDFVFVSTINIALSSQYDSIKNLEKEEEYKGNIYVINTHTQCYGLEDILLESKKML